MALDDLTDKQEMFCQQYIIDFNGAQAAIRAGYSPNTAKEIASENLTKPNIKARIDELKADLFKAVGITQARVYRELARLSFFDIRSIYTETGALKNIKDFDDDSAAAVSGIKVYDEFGEKVDEDGAITKGKVGETVEIKLVNKVSALENIIKIAGWQAPVKSEITAVVWNEQKTYEAKPEADAGA